MCTWGKAGAGWGGAALNNGRKVPNHTWLDHILNPGKSPKQAESWISSITMIILVSVQSLIWANFTQAMWILCNGKKTEMKGDLCGLTHTHTYIHNHDTYTYKKCYGGVFTKVWRIHFHALLYIKQINSKDLLCGPGNHSHYLVITYNGKESEKEQKYAHTHTHTHTCILHIYV